MKHMMPAAYMLAAALAVASAGHARGASQTAEPTVDFSREIGPVRPEIHSSGFGPTICSQTAQDLEDLKAMGFKYARTHDWE